MLIMGLAFDSAQTNSVYEMDELSMFLELLLGDVLPVLVVLGRWGEKRDQFSW